jgi:DNA-binding transcriptional ArsR family regulator
MVSGEGERSSPPPESVEGARRSARPAALHLPHPVPDLLRSMLIARFRALSNHTRFRVWDALRDGEASVSELADRLPFSQQSVSSALLELHHAGLVEREQIGSRACYRLTDGSMEHALAVQQLSINRRAARFARELRQSQLTPD